MLILLCFSGKGIVTLLESLKRLASVLNALPVIRCVTLYGDIPDGWLYRTWVAFYITAINYH
jgi:hypothetical protein